MQALSNCLKMSYGTASGIKISPLYTFYIWNGIGKKDKDINACKAFLLWVRTLDKDF